MSTVDLFLQSYCYRHHYLHQPGYDVFAFLDRAAVRSGARACFAPTRAASIR